MDLRSYLAAGLACVAILAVAGCGGGETEVLELKHYPVDGLEGLVSRDGATLDGLVTADGNGALCLTAAETTTFRLYETGDLDVEGALLTYEAKLRTEDVAGQAYLEMLCHFPGQGEAFSRALPSALSGTNEWSSQTAPFRLERGQNPDNIRLNLVIEGGGTVWIDDVHVMQGPLP